MIAVVELPIYHLTEVTAEDVIWSVVVPMTYRLGVKTRFFEVQSGE